MVDPTSDFFESLGRDGAGQLANVTATIRVDLDHARATEHWLVEVDNSRVSISRRNGRADAVLHTDKHMFDRLVRGEANPVASLLRGLMQADGDAELILIFQGLFPAPISSHSRRMRPDEA